MGAPPVEVWRSIPNILMYLCVVKIGSPSEMFRCAFSNQLISVGRHDLRNEHDLRSLGVTLGRISATQLLFPEQREHRTAIVEELNELFQSLSFWDKIGGQEVRLVFVVEKKAVGGRRTAWSFHQLAWWIVQFMPHLASPGIRLQDSNEEFIP